MPSRIEGISQSCLLPRQMIGVFQGLRHFVFNFGCINGEFCQSSDPLIRVVPFVDQDLHVCPVTSPNQASRTSFAVFTGVVQCPR